MYIYIYTSSVGLFIFEQSFGCFSNSYITHMTFLSGICNNICIEDRFEFYKLLGSKVHNCIHEAIPPPALSTIYIMIDISARYTTSTQILLMDSIPSIYKGKFGSFSIQLQIYQLMDSQSRTAWTEKIIVMHQNININKLPFNNSVANTIQLL